jgi:hypothetical protein
VTVLVFDSEIGAVSFAFRLGCTGLLSGAIVDFSCAWLSKRDG